MSYKFQTLYSTDDAINCDISKINENECIGRLYILKTEEPTLLKLGIEKEWFLAHESGHFLICGHINHAGEWSLSSYKSLEPSLKYTNQTEIFDRVFSQEYVREVLYRQGDTFVETSIVTTDSDSSNSGQVDDSDIIGDKSDTKILETRSINTTNLDVLKDLILSSAPEELLGLQEKEEEKVLALQTSSIEPEKAVTNIIFTEHIANIETESTELEYFELLEIQRLVIDKIIEECEQIDVHEFILPPFGLVTISMEDDYFVLHSESGEHRILSATFGGEVIDELNRTDALELIEIMYQTQMQNVIKPKLEMEQKLEIPNTEINPQKGIDYGT
jgi:hypothetical protein